MTLFAKERINVKKAIHTDIRLQTLAVAICVLLAGCGAPAGPGDIPDPDPPGTEAVDERPQDMGAYGYVGPPEENVSGPLPETSFQGSDVNPVWFEDSLQAYLDNDAGWGNKSYMVSPASFRAALCLMIEGAEGDTKSGLLEAAKFDDEDAMAAWYGSLLEAQACFNESRDVLEQASAEWGDGRGTGMSFDIANAVWDNSSFHGGFSKEFAETVREKYGAEAGSSDAEHITDDVNGWCSEKTHGMIASIAPDLSGVRSVLANALYVKSAWISGFQAGNTERGRFAVSDGPGLELEFMRQTGDFLYYKDPEGRRYALFGLEGGLWITICLDPGARPQDMMSAMYNAKRTLLDVRMPKLDLETTLGSGELAGYLAQNGAADALGENACFTAMTDPGTAWRIGDVIQKTRIKTDEDGLEAAAVTIFMTTDGMVPDEPAVPIEFHMDAPFSFMITAGRHTPDSGALILFTGRYAG